MSTITPKKITHYYSYPSLINGAAGVVATAAAEYANYDVVVWGAGIEDPSHPDNTKAGQIIADPQMASTEVYGYIDTTLSLVDIQEKIDNWYNIGTKGIFLDKFGYDWSNTRDHQNEVVWCIHEKGTGLKAYVNAWNPDDALGSLVDATYNPSGKAPWIGVNDMYLLESYQIVAGDYKSQCDWLTRADKVAGYKAGSFPDTLMVGLTTYADAMAFDQDKLDYAYLSAVMDELDGFGWGEFAFSASGSSVDQLPLRTLPPFHGTKHTGAIVVNGTVVERQQNVGIHIDTSTNSTSLLLD